MRHHFLVIMLLLINNFTYANGAQEQTHPTQTFSLYEERGMFLSHFTLSTGKSLNLWWDTGANYSVLDKKSVDPHSGVVVVKPGDKPARPVVLNLEAGGQNFPVGFLGADLENFTKFVNLHGIIGSTAFYQHTLIFDFSKLSVTLSDKLDIDSNFDFEIINGWPVMTILINGSPYKALIDTGLNDNFDVPDFSKMNLVSSKEYTGLSSLQVDHSFIKSNQTQAQTVSILGETFDSIVLSEAKREVPYYQIALGAGFFKHGILALDYKTKKGYWKRKTDAIIQTVFFPFGVFQDKKGLKITRLEEGLVTNPFRIDDVIVSVDSENLSSYDSLLAKIGHGGSHQFEILRGTETLVLSFDLSQSQEAK